MGKSEYTKELKTRNFRLCRWLEENSFKMAAILKEEIEFSNGNYLYYGGKQVSAEYGGIIVDSGGARFAIAHEYAFQRVKASGAFNQVYEIRQSVAGLISALSSLIKERGYSPRDIAIDTGSISASTLFLMRKHGLKPNENDLKQFIFSQRGKKSEYEIREMQGAIGIAKRALDDTVESLRPGLSVNQITRLLNKSIIEEGGIGTSFETDIRILNDLDETETGKLERGHLLLFDFGAKLSSMYLSDIGRTFVYGSASMAFRDLMNDVYSIKRSGLKKISEGKSGNQVRREIDSIIREHGYVSTHREGHQIGLNVHEPYGPHLAYGEENSTLLSKGNVVTWEPGIGLPNNNLPKNRFGLAHMEDMVYVDSGSNSRVLGHVPLQYG